MIREVTLIKSIASMEGPITQCSPQFNFNIWNPYLSIIKFCEGFECKVLSNLINKTHWYWLW
jgi:hypothetical protein